MASAYRYGNDIRVYWTIIDSEGQPYNLEGRDLRLWMKNGTRKFEILDYHVAGNIITWVYYGKNQSNCFLGTFEAILCENCGEIGMATLDTQDVFRLVSRSKDASAGDGVRVRTEAVVNIQTQLTSSVEQLCITKEEYEDIFGVGSATHGGSAMETPDVLASLKDYIDRENIEDIYVLDTYPAVGTVYSEDVFDAMVTSKAVVIEGNDAILGRAIHLEGGSYLSFLKITSADKSGVVVVATLSHGEDDYTVTALTETVVVDRAYLEANFLTIADASATYLSKIQAVATYLKITDAAVQYVAKTGGVFTGAVSFSAGMSATSGSFSGEVDMSNHRVKNVANPVNDADAANKGWVVALIGTLNQFHYEVYPSLASVTNPSGSVLYLIGPSGSGDDKYEEYVYDSTKTNPWIKIGDTSVDLSGYAQLSGATFTGRVTVEGDLTVGGDFQTNHISEDASSDHISINARIDMDGFGIDMDNNTIQNVGTPVNNTDAANKAYVDSHHDVFWATYGTTTNAEINAEVAAGRIVACKWYNEVYYLTRKDDGDHDAFFICIDGRWPDVVRWLRVTSDDDSWSDGTMTLQQFALVTSLSNTSDNSHYPSAKAVYDALALKANADLVPAQASAQNQLADKAFVNSSVQTATANFRGNYGNMGQIPVDAESYPADYAGSTTPTTNDYMVVVDVSPEEVAWIPDVYYDYHEIVASHDPDYTTLDYFIAKQGNINHAPAYNSNEPVEDDYWKPLPDYNVLQVGGTWRFKYTGLWSIDNAEGWLPEYQVNEKPLTAAQLAALNSGITDTKVAKLDALPATIPTEVYWCTYSESGQGTQASEVATAISAGKIVAVQNGQYTFVLTRETSSEYAFYLPSSDTIRRVSLSKSTNKWSGGAVGFELASSKKTDIPANRTSDTYYPTTKAVFDLTSKWGVISQMQTWSEVTPGGAYTYALSDIVQGAIPISFIDLVRVADNANFNTSTGYFEINDLTDVSYEEMMVIHDVNEVAKVMCTLGGQQLRQFFEHKEPRTITICNNGVNSINYNYSFRRFGTTNTKTETIAIGSDMADILWSTGFSEAFYRCQYLRKIGIYGSLKPTSSSTSFSLAFTQCRSLTDLRITGLASSISLADSYYAAPISMASLAYIINNAGTATITITVGSAIYTAAQSDADVQAALQSKTNVSLASA